MKTLIFIDTNIFLDFYRNRGYPDVSNTLLTLINKNHDLIITTEQVEMEFKKNRQKVILETLDAFKKQCYENVPIPGILKDKKLDKQLKKSRRGLDAVNKKIKLKLHSILVNPEYHDEIYKTSLSLFKNRSDLNLSREKKIKHVIRAHARKRYFLGYPPRKHDNSSTMGDAINWEWIVHCAIVKKANVVIVSRDDDYGISIDDKRILNDWLKFEFKDRTSRKRHITLTNKLTDALKEAKVEVLPDLDRNEDEMVSRLNRHDACDVYEDILTFAMNNGFNVVDASIDGSDGVIYLPKSNMQVKPELYRKVMMYVNKRGKEIRFL